MVVVLHDYGGYPFIFDISQQLSLKGFKVYHIYSSASGSPQGNFAENENLKVIDLSINSPKVKKNSFAKRFIQEYRYGKIISHKIIEINPDVVLSSNTPLLAQIQLIKACNNHKIYVIHWLQDLLSLAAKKVLSKKNLYLGKIVGYLFYHVEKKCLALSDEVITISKNFSVIIGEWGIESTKIKLFENWAQINEIPLVSKDNFFSEIHGLKNSFNIIYTGTLGMKQNPEVLLEIAKYYRKHNSVVKIIVVASGDGFEYLKEEIEKYKLSNLLCLPLQPYEDLPKVLGSADLLIATLNEDAGDYCVPSKVLSYYCAGKASLLIMPIHNQAAIMTIENDLGIVFSPNDQKGLFEKLDFYLSNVDLLSQKGSKARLFAKQNFQPEVLCDKFLDLLPQLN
jgi:colanic acid biosynthesis glycosyl transferase WcaI